MKKMSMTKDEKLKRNTNFLRECARGKGTMRAGQWLHSLPKKQQAAVMKLVFEYSDWNEKTDPSGTHATGVVIYDGHYVLFSIADRDVTPSAVLLMEPRLEFCLMIKHSSEI